MLVGAPRSDTVDLLDSQGNLLRTFTNPNPARSDTFGSSVALIDKNILIGAGSVDLRALDSRSAYLFAEDGSLLKTFEDPNPESLNQYGNSAAVTEDKIVVVSAPESTIGADRAGRVHLFDGDPDSPTFGNLIRTIDNPAPAGGGRFGVAVSVSGRKIFVGADLNDVGGSDTGAVYLFDGDPSSPTFGENRGRFYF